MPNGTGGLFRGKWEGLIERSHDCVGKYSMNQPIQYFLSLGSKNYEEEEKCGVKHSEMSLRGAIKYYFADFVRKGGGGVTPQIRNPLFAEKNP